MGFSGLPPAATRRSCAPRAGDKTRTPTLPVRHTIAAVFATMNRARTAEACVRSLAGQTRPPDLVLEPDDGGRAELRPRRPDHLGVVLDHFGLLAEEEAEGAGQVADVQRLVVLVQNENDAVHGGRRITSSPERAV